MNPGRVTSLNPYDKALLYRNAWWKGPVYLPFKEKHPPPIGFTGHAAPYPTVDQITEWMTDGRHNIGLRLAGVDTEHEIVGIDVDHYIKGDKDKRGGDQLHELEIKLGRLPETWTSSARTDGKSGIRYFRVPRGFAFRGQVDKDIECISKGYRFAVVWPSIHPEGTPYWWFPPGTPLTKEGTLDWDQQTLPDARDLPLLPDPWVEHLKNPKGAVYEIDNDSSVKEIYDWVEDTFPGDQNTLPCERMREKLDLHKTLIEDEATSHDKLLNAHWNMSSLAIEGHLGWSKAVDELETHFTDVTLKRGKREDDEVRGEIFRSRTNALRKLKAKNDDIGISCDKTGCVGNPGGLNVGGAPHTWDTDKHSDQLRMAYRFASEHDGKLIYVFDVGWHYWDGKRWAKDNRGKTHRMLMATLKKAWGDAQLLPNAPVDEQKRLLSCVKACEKFNGMQGVLSIASKMKQFANTVNDLDLDPYLVNVRNGTLDLRTMSLLSHNPEDKITKICRAEYQPEIRSELWENFLKRVLPDSDVREYLQRLAGIAMLGTVKEHLLAILTGEGRNGKSTFYEAMLHAMGDYGCVAEPDLFMQRDGAHSTGQMDLLGSRLVIVSESDKNQRLAEATMRRLTGGDTIKARYMRQNFVTFDPSHTAMLITNHLPKVTNDSPATWARMRVIPFDVVIPKEERDIHLAEKLKDVTDAVLTWALSGWEQYSAIGMAEPDAVLAATERYRSDSDDVQAWINECCVVGSEAVGHEIMSNKLHNFWKGWQMDNGCPPMGLQDFNKALEAKGFPTSGARRLRQGIAMRPIESGGFTVVGGS